MRSSQQSQSPGDELGLGLGLGLGYGDGQREGGGPGQQLNRSKARASPKRKRSSSSCPSSYSAYGTHGTCSTDHNTRAASALHIQPQPLEQTQTHGSVGNGTGPATRSRSADRAFKIRSQLMVPSETLDSSREVEPRLWESCVALRSPNSRILDRTQDLAYTPCQTSLSQLSPHVTHQLWTDHDTPQASEETSTHIKTSSNQSSLFANVSFSAFRETRAQSGTNNFMHTDMRSNPQDTSLSSISSPSTPPAYSIHAIMSPHFVKSPTQDDEMNGDMHFLNQALPEPEHVMFPRARLHFSGSSDEELERPSRRSAARARKAQTPKLRDIQNKRTERKSKLRSSITSRECSANQNQSCSSNANTSMQSSTTFESVLLSSPKHNPQTSKRDANLRRDQPGEVRLVRPLPDQSAFENTRKATNSGGRDHRMGADGSPSPICPPTPQRTPMWTQDHFLNLSWTMGESLLFEDKVLGPDSTNQSSDGGITFSSTFVNLGLLGEGMFAEVWKVRSKHNHKTYAVKKSKKPFRSEKERELLSEEYRILTKIGPCTYIPQLYRCWQEERYLYIQMELCERGTLKNLGIQLRREGACWSNSSILKILHDLCCALQHTHTHGFVHMDVKPSNVLISSQGYLKLADFDRACRACSCSQTCTCTGECICTCECDGREGDLRYMAPELLPHTHCHPSCDMFSLGMTVLELCTGVCEVGNLPSAGTEWQLLRQGVSDWPSLRQGDAFPPWDEGVSVLSRTAVAKLLHPNPSIRPSAQTLLNMLDTEHSSEDDMEVIISSAPTVECVSMLTRAPSVLLESKEPHSHAHIGTIHRTNTPTLAHIHTPSPTNLRTPTYTRTRLHAHMKDEYLSGVENHDTSNSQMAQPMQVEGSPTWHTPSNSTPNPNTGSHGKHRHRHAHKSEPSRVQTRAQTLTNTHTSSETLSNSHPHTRVLRPRTRTHAHTYNPVQEELVRPVCRRRSQPTSTPKKP